MTASTAPTQPPDKCPACGETKVRYNTGKIIQFMCNCIMGVDGSDPCECSRAFSAAIALRAERDAALARAEKAEGERDIHKSERMELAKSLEFMMSQCAAARARLAELQAVCDAAIEWSKGWEETIMKEGETYHMMAEDIELNKAVISAVAAVRGAGGEG